MGYNYARMRNKVMLEHKHILGVFSDYIPNKTLSSYENSSNNIRLTSPEIENPLDYFDTKTEKYSFFCLQ